MTEVDRELRDRLEEAQSDLKRAHARLDELEDAAADAELLRSDLDAAQAELKSATERLAELEDQSTESLMAELDAVSRDRDLLRQRLEQADKTREQWDGKLAQREAELAMSRAEEGRLRTELVMLRHEVGPAARLMRRLTSPAVIIAALCATWLVVAVYLFTR